MKHSLFRLLRSPLLIVLYPGSGAPVALRVNARKFAIWGTTFCFMLLLGALGTVLFFREVEVSRHLVGRLAEVETEVLLAKVTKAALAVAQVTTPAKTLVAAPLIKSAEPVAVVAPDAERTAASVTAGATAKPAVIPARARIQELETDCSEAGKCAVKLSLVPAGSGAAQGKLLIVLESEVPRIGGAQAGSSPGAVRKRYSIYPGTVTKDELSTEQVARLDGKTFRFNRILQTTADFSFSPVLRPMAINIYLFDAQNVLSQHERRVIETEER